MGDKIFLIIIGASIAIPVLICLSMKSEIERLNDKIKYLEGRLKSGKNTIYDIEETNADGTENDLVAEVRVLKESDQVVKAIKLVRDNTGMSLAEAKEFVENIK